MCALSDGYFAEIQPVRRDFAITPSSKNLTRNARKIRPHSTIHQSSKQFWECNSSRFRQCKLFISDFIWELIRDKFPDIEVRNLLAPQYETFDELTLTPGQFKWRMSDSPELPRAWYLGVDSHAGQQLIQIQRDRFLQNWRRDSLEEENYPSYQQNRSQFEGNFRRYVDFVNEHQFGRVDANQCEVTYVNRMIVPEERSFGEMIAEWFPILKGQPSDDFLSDRPEQANFGFSYRIEGTRGRLHISGRPAALAFQICLSLEIISTSSTQITGLDCCSV